MENINMNTEINENEMENVDGAGWDFLDKSLEKVKIGWFDFFKKND